MRISEIITESAGRYVYRVDSEQIHDFEPDLKTYYHNKDFSVSGRSDFKGSVGKSQGVYAGDLSFTALYATGSSDGPNKTRYMAIYGPGQPTAYFDKKDVARIRKNHSWLTAFNASNFRKLPSGEYFSEHPGKPVKQIAITDPFQYMRDRGWEFKFVDNLEAELAKAKKLHAKQIKQGVPENQQIRFGAEGLGYQ